MIPAAAGWDIVSWEGKKATPLPPAVRASAYYGGKPALLAVSLIMRSPWDETMRLLDKFYRMW
jgi:hypothetical protein